MLICFVQDDEKMYEKLLELHFNNE